MDMGDTGNNGISLAIFAILNRKNERRQRLFFVVDKPKDL